jgi:hypothetical protein
VRSFQESDLACQVIITVLHCERLAVTRERPEIAEMAFATVVIIKLFGSRRNSAYVSDVDAEQDAIENKYNALRKEVLPKAEMETRRRLNEQEPLKPVRS